MNKGMIDTVRVILNGHLKVVNTDEGKQFVAGINKATRHIAHLLELRNKQIDKLRNERDALRAELDVVTGSDTEDPRARLSALIKRKQGIEGEIANLENQTS